MSSFCPVVLTGICCLLCVASKPSGADVVAVARSFNDGGGYNKQWEGSGSPEEIRFKGSVILPIGKEGTYCSGLTFAVVMRVCSQFKILEGHSTDAVRRFQQEWYGVPSETKEKQSVVALQRLSIGREVTLDEARAGDFGQFWRSDGTGHSFVFLGWLTAGEKKVAIKYRSSQSATNGVGDSTEYFEDVTGKKGQVIRSRVYFGRVGN
jgi:hypothetical protein